MEKRPTDFTVMTFNVNGQLRHGWERRSSAISAILTSTEADIIGFQEFGETNWPTYTLALPDYEIYLGDQAGDIYINPIAWNRERFEIIESKTIWLSETPEIYSRGWDGSERGVSIVRLRAKGSREEIGVFNVHLDNIGEKARINGIGLVLSLVEEYSEIPIIILGDFNCSPYAPHDNAVYSREPYDLLIEAGFEDAWASAHPESSEIPYTFHGYRGDKYIADEFGTWHTDWIMARGLCLQSYAIIREVKQGEMPSDHYPVCATYKW